MGCQLTLQGGERRVDLLRLVEYGVRMGDR